MQIRLLTLLSIASWVSTEMADVSLGKVYQDLKSWAVYRLPAYALTNLSNNKPYHTFTIVLSHFVCTKFFSCHLLTSFVKLATTSHQYSTCRQIKVDNEEREDSDRQTILYKNHIARAVEWGTNLMWRQSLMVDFGQVHLGLNHIVIFIKGSKKE